MLFRALKQFIALSEHIAIILCDPIFSTQLIIIFFMYSEVTDSYPVSITSCNSSRPSGVTKHIAYNPKLPLWVQPSKVMVKTFVASFIIFSFHKFNAVSQDGSISPVSVFRPGIFAAGFKKLI